MAKAFARPDKFFDHNNERYTSITLDDALLMPQHTDIFPETTDISTIVAGGVSLKIPIIAAAMDTVTEAAMSIAIGKTGGSSVIHRLLSPEAQAKMVERVHYEMRGLVRSPITKPAMMRVHELEDWLAERKKNGKTVFDTHPIVDKQGHLLGLVGGKEIRYCRDKDLCLQDIMTKFDDLVKASVVTQSRQAYELMLAKRVSALPLLDDHRHLAGMFLLTDLERKFSVDGSAYNLDDEGQLIVGAAVGTSEAEIERIEALIAVKVNFIVIDTAHGDSNAAAAQVRTIKRMTHTSVLAGNVATEEGALLLAEAGADGIKVGIGPGSICTTRIVAGIGVPQLSAVHACARAVRKFGIPVCADGGVRSSGDIVKLLAAGASSVMIGSLLAGTDESPGKLSIVRGREVKDYRGMGSEAVMAINADRYRQKSGSFVAEGIETSVVYRGSVARVVDTLMNGLRAGLAYNGARTITELKEKAMFTRITNNGLVESYPHDVLFYDK